MAQEPDLKLRTARTLKWNSIDRFSSQILYAVTGIILANVLPKEDFGLVGAILVFQAFATIFVDSGFGSALLQKKAPTDRDYSTVFWFNLIVSCTLYLLLFFSAPSIARMFQGDVRLIPLSRVMFLSFIINGLGIVQTNLLMKAMTVRRIALSNITGLVVSGGAGIWMALSGFGAWALVWQTIILASVRTLWLWLGGSWRPMCCFSLESLRSIYRVGAGVFTTSLFNTIFLNIYSFVIGVWPHRPGRLHTGRQMEQNGQCQPLANPHRDFRTPSGTFPGQSGTIPRHDGQGEPPHRLYGLSIYGRTGGYGAGHLPHPVRYQMGLGHHPVPAACGPRHLHGHLLALFQLPPLSGLCPDIGNSGDSERYGHSCGHRSHRMDALSGDTCLGPAGGRSADMDCHIGTDSTSHRLQRPHAHLRDDLLPDTRHSRNDRRMADRNSDFRLSATPPASGLHRIAHIFRHPRIAARPPPQASQSILFQKTNITTSIFKLCPNSQ